MTAKQIEKKLTAAGIAITNLDIGKDRVGIYVADTDGDCDRDATDTLKDRVQQVLPWGGSRSGHGGWQLYENYVATSEDYCVQK